MKYRELLDLGAEEYRVGGGKRVYFDQRNIYLPGDDYGPGPEFIAVPCREAREVILREASLSEVSKLPEKLYNMLLRPPVDRGFEELQVLLRNKYIDFGDIEKAASILAAFGTDDDEIAEWFKKRLRCKVSIHRVMMSFFWSRKWSIAHPEYKDFKSGLRTGLNLLLAQERKKQKNYSAKAAWKTADGIIKRFDKEESS
jgi:hypothetical protein